MATELQEYFGFDAASYEADTASDEATTTCPINTPSTTTAGTDCLSSSRGAVPYPEKTFQIIEKRSGKAITVVDNKLKLKKLGSASSNDTHWFCVKQDGYFGFQNPMTGSYLGHHGKSRIHASAPALTQEELWAPREQPHFFVRQHSYLGFPNPMTGGYLGHDGKSGIQASAPALTQRELWTPREHPEGGYELLSPSGGTILMILCVDSDESTLVRRRHGTTLWEFVRV